MVGERILIWQEGEYQYPAAYGFVPFMISYIHEDKQIRPGMVVVPGGAYRGVSPSEGHIVAEEFYRAGYNVFVLVYTVNPVDEPLKLQPLNDISRAVRMVRSRAEELHIDSSHIAVCGFSAGGHLAGCLGTMWDGELLDEALGATYVSGTGRKMWKPDGMILCYPVITMGEYTHQESRSLLLGEQDTEEMRRYLSLENRVTDKTVPAFLWHTQEDADVPVENSLQFAMALRKNRIPFELHIYEKGCHGLSLCDETVDDGNKDRLLLPDNTGWLKMSVNWLKRR